MGLTLTIKTGSSLVIGDHTIVRVVSVRGGQARLELVSTEGIVREQLLDPELVAEIEERIEDARAAGQRDMLEEVGA